jgi:hypothetical protein
MRRVAAVIAAVVASLLAAGCSRPASTASLFPLEGGHRWVYEVRTAWDGEKVERETRVITTEGESSLDGASAWRRRSADGVEWFLRADDSGVYRVASKTDLEAEPQPDKTPRYVLKAPLRVGTSWQATTPAYLLRRRAEFPPEIRHTHAPALMTYTIDSLEDTVEVPAGRWDNCLRVAGRASLRLFADPVAGWRDMPLVTTEWYCRGPGLVRLVREEAAQSTFLTGGTMTLELISWQ